MCQRLIYTVHKVDKDSENKKKTWAQNYEQR